MIKRSSLLSHSLRIRVAMIYSWTLMLYHISYIPQSSPQQLSTIITPLLLPSIHQVRQQKVLWSWLYNEHKRTWCHPGTMYLNIKERLLEYCTRSLRVVYWDLKRKYTLKVIGTNQVKEVRMRLKGQYLIVLTFKFAVCMEFWNKSFHIINNIKIVPVIYSKSNHH